MSLSETLRKPRGAQKKPTLSKGAPGRSRDGEGGEGGADFRRGSFGGLIRLLKGLIRPLKGLIRPLRNL